MSQSSGRICAGVLIALVVVLARPSTLTAQEADPHFIWDPSWNRVSKWEWVGAGALLGTATALRFLGPEPELTWEGGLWFDEPLYRAVAPEKYGVWRTVANISHIGFGGSIAYRLIEDLAVVGGGYESWDVAWQMAGMDAQALAIIATTLWIPQMWIGRERPSLIGCDDPDIIGNKCEEGSPERYRSFWAGHPATTVAMAGLTCVHHSRLGIYGRPWDAVACGSMIGVAVVAGMSRVVAGYHWATDVLIGTAVGTAAWMIPTALHYGFGRSEEDLALSEQRVQSLGSGTILRASFAF